MLHTTRTDRPIRSFRLTALTALCGGLALLAFATPASAWLSQGHQRATRIAIDAVDDELPPFFSEGKATIAHVVVDADINRMPTTPQLRNSEAPQHYFDLEVIQGLDIPPTRYEFLKLCAEHDINPTRVGMAPYAVAEWTQRLTIALAEHRRWPDNPHVRAKVLIAAGMLAHYAQDITQPLHLTVHFDGRLHDDGSSPRTGIHFKVDNVLALVEADDAAVAESLDTPPIDDVFAYVTASINETAKLVDAVYALESQLPPDDATDADLTEPVQAMFEDRLTRAAEITAALYRAAWQKSADIELPDWLDRSTDEGEAPHAHGKSPSSQPATSQPAASSTR